MQDKPKLPQKQTFCRYYLRGICSLSTKECSFAHGVWDLNYTPWQGQEVIYEIDKTKEQQPGEEPNQPYVYKILYDLQDEKVYTLEQLNTEKSARDIMRTQLNKRLYENFMQLLEKKYPEMPLTQTFLHREFNRVGFNKIFMSEVKFNQIVGYLCENPPHSKYFRTTLNKQNVIMRKAPLQDILKAYRKAFSDIIAQGQRDEVEIKKKIFNAKMPERVPPLGFVLKQLKITLKELLEDRLGINGEKLIAECSVATVTELALKFLEEELPKRVLDWQDVFQYLSKSLKNNNGNLINQAKPHLALQENAFLSFPMHQLIYNPSLKTPFPREKCLCPFQAAYPKQQLPISSLEQCEPLVEGQSYDIYNFQTLNRCAAHLLNSKVIGVDLQGRLRKRGFVEMVQLNNGRNTFLIDIWQMNELGDFEAFWLARKVLRNVMVDENIVKVFHDCRHDSIGLHEILQTCIVNVFDTSATETLIGQLKTYYQLWKQKKDQQIKDQKPTNKIRDKLLVAAKQVISQCANVRTPGLNEIFQRYQASHGINKNKDKFHNMWSKGDFSFFCKRPIDPEYRDYCIRDVLDLPQVYTKMLGKLEGSAQHLAFWISNQYAKQGFEILTEEKDQK